MSCEEVADKDAWNNSGFDEPHIASEAHLRRSTLSDRNKMEWVILWPVDDIQVKIWLDGHNIFYFPKCGSVAQLIVFWRPGFESFEACFFVRPFSAVSSIAVDLRESFLYLQKKNTMEYFQFETLSFWKSFGDRTVHNTKKRRITIVELVSDFVCFWAGHQLTLCWTFPIFNKARNSIQAFWGVPG